jgi:putative ABC transport system permease protein
VIITGLNFALLLAFTKRINRSANRFLALALAVMVLWIASIWDNEIKLPLQFSLALGPLIYFYVRKLTRPDYKFSRKDLLHLIPVLLEQVIPQNQVLPFLMFISVAGYLYGAHRLIERFYRRQKFMGGDRYRHELRWLHRLLTGFGLLWLLWIPYTIIGYYYHLSGQAYYLFYLGAAVMLIWIAVSAYLRPGASAAAVATPITKPLLPAEMKQKGAWLKNMMKANLYYQDPELSLYSLAERFGMSPHELSRIINTVLKKSFNDFINEYRVRDVASKINDPAYDHITLLGIAYGSGFNSKSTFNLIFKKMTGRTPAEYKTIQKKEFLSYNLGRHDQFAAIISNPETTLTWSQGKLNRSFMFKNYLKIGWRTLLSNKLFSLINISGLSIGLACCMLIVLYTKDELSFDRFQAKKDQLYRLTCRVIDPAKGRDVIYGEAGAVQGPAFKDAIPEIQEYVRTEELPVTVKSGSEAFTEKVTWVDRNFFSVFTFPLIYGNAKTVLTDPHSIILTEETARKYFGQSDAIGKTLQVKVQQQFESFIVTGIAKNAPENSSVKFNMLLPFNYIATLTSNDHGYWHLLNYSTFFVLSPGTDVRGIERKMNQVYKFRAGMQIAEIVKQGRTVKFAWGLQPFLKMHLDTRVINEKSIKDESKPIYSYILLAIASLILLIACINFINLTIAQSLKRSREIGLRKVIGGTRVQLACQFLGESFILCCTAFALALLIVRVVLPLFNELANKELSLTYLLDPTLIILFIGLLLITGFIAGVYPAFVLSGFKPVEILRDGVGAMGKNYVSKALITVQFALATFLIIGTIVIYSQYNYLTNTDLGYNDKNLLSVTASGEEKDARVLDLLKSKFSAIPGVQRVAKKMLGGWNTGAIANNKDIDIDYDAIDPDYLSTMQIPLLMGRNFSKDRPADSIQSAIVNEAFVREAGWKNPIGKPIDFVDDKPSNMRVIGVVKDYHFSSLKEKIKPKLFTMNPELGYGQFMLKLQPGNVTQTLARIENIYNNVLPFHPFEYYFVDEKNRENYAAESRWKAIILYATSLTVFISCIGLLGLSLLAVARRTKEIGVRKVLGANVRQIWGMIVKDFVWLVFGAFLVAMPPGWYFANKWLRNFPYRITLDYRIFAGAALLILIVVVITISFNAVKAARANPVKSLRSE